MFHQITLLLGMRCSEFTQVFPYFFHASNSLQNVLRTFEALKIVFLAVLAYIIKENIFLLFYIPKQSDKITTVATQHNVVWYSVLRNKHR